MRNVRTFDNGISVVPVHMPDPFDHAIVKLPFVPNASNRFAEHSPDRSCPPKRVSTFMNDVNNFAGLVVLFMVINGTISAVLTR